MLTELEKLEDESKYVRLTLEEIEINIEFAGKQKQIKVLEMWKKQKHATEDMLSNILILLMREEQHVSGAQI